MLQLYVAPWADLLASKNSSWKRRTFAARSSQVNVNTLSLCTWIAASIRRAFPMWKHCLMRFSRPMRFSLAASSCIINLKCAALVVALHSSRNSSAWWFALHTCSTLFCSMCPTALECGVLGGAFNLAYLFFAIALTECAVVVGLVPTGCVHCFGSATGSAAAFFGNALAGIWLAVGTNGCPLLRWRSWHLSSKLLEKPGPIRAAWEMTWARRESPVCWGITISKGCRAGGNFWHSCSLGTGMDQSCCWEAFPTRMPKAARAALLYMGHIVRFPTRRASPLDFGCLDNVFTGHLSASVECFIAIGSSSGSGSVSNVEKKSSGSLEHAALRCKTSRRKMSTPEISNRQSKKQFNKQSNRQSDKQFVDNSILSNPIVWDNPIGNPNWIL